MTAADDTAPVLGHPLYAMLHEQALARARSEGASIGRVLLGLNWSLVELNFASSNPGQSRASTGLCFSPPAPARTFPQAGGLSELAVAQALGNLGSWDECSATVAVALSNALLNERFFEQGEGCDTLDLSSETSPDCPPHLRVFDYFAPQLKGKKVAIIGHYPGLENLPGLACQLCIERRPQVGDFPDAAAEYLLPAMDWVFITASSIANKTLPHLLALSEKATVVLMGPSLPWLEQWRDFGVDYLAGVKVNDAGALWTTAAEAGGTRIFAGPVAYHLLKL